MHEDSKIQEEINRWVRETNDKGIIVKLGFGKVVVEVKWVRWEETENIEAERREKWEGGFRLDHKWCEYDEKRTEQVEVGIEVRGMGGKGGRKLIFWNIAGLKDKDRDVRNYLEAGDFISVVEKWVEENIKFTDQLSKQLIWELMPASTEKKIFGKGRFLIRGQERLDRKGRNGSVNYTWRFA